MGRRDGDSQEWMDPRCCIGAWVNAEWKYIVVAKRRLAFPHPFKEKPVRLPEWLKEKSEALPSQPSQPSLL